jgi:apolipoprotein N-acyltransferase
MAGFSMTMFGFYWMIGMLQVFGGFSLPVCFLMMSAVCAYQAGRISMLGWFCARAEVRGWPFGACFAVAFAASEFLFPLLFPWFYGATVHQVPALIQVVELGNPILLGLILVAPNLAIAEPVIARLQQRTPRWRLALGLCVVPVAAAVYGAIRIPQVDAQVVAAPKARVGVVQANMDVLGKRLNPQEGIERHVRLTHELKRSGPVDLVVWSETSDMEPVEEADATTQFPDRFTRSLGVPIIFGGILVRPVPDVREFVWLNSALAADVSGTITGRYDKRFLLAFGEYVPFGDYFPTIYEWLPQAGRYGVGEPLAPLNFGGREVAVSICYEDIIPSFFNRLVRDSNPDLLVNMTNDAWFGDTTAPWIHLGLARLRAVEHRRFLVRATNSGVSAFVDPVGRVVARTDVFKQQAKVSTIAWLKSRTPYEMYGDIPWWLASAAAVAMSFVRRSQEAAGASM